MRSLEQEWVAALDKGLARGYTSPDGKSFRYKLPKDGIRALETHQNWSAAAIDEVARISGPVVAFDPDGFWLLAEGRAWPRGLFAAILQYAAEYLRAAASVELPPEPVYRGGDSRALVVERADWERERKRVVDFYRAQAPHARDRRDRSEYASVSESRDRDMAAALARIGPYPKAPERSPSEETAYFNWKDRNDRREEAKAALTAWGKDLPPPPAPRETRGGSW